MITFEMVNKFLLKFVIFLWDFLMVALLFFAMAILVTGTIFMFRAAFILWFDGVDIFKLWSDFSEKMVESIHNLKNKIKGLIA